MSAVARSEASAVLPSPCDVDRVNDDEPDSRIDPGCFAKDEIMALTAISSRH